MMKLKLVENIEVLEEAVDPSEALKIKKDSDAYAILYGWKYKNEPAIEIYPEEHSEESLKLRLRKIITDYNKYSDNPRGNRYAKESDFIFYILYNKNKLKESLTEAKRKKTKKRKSPRLDYIEFNTPGKLKAWVKKRQKGLSPFTYLNPNAGDVEYNNSMFNHMMGSADGASSLGVSDGGISNGGLSAPAGDAGGGAMGESLCLKEDSNQVIQRLANNVIEANKDMLDDKLDQFIAYCFNACDERVFNCILNMLKDSGIEIPNPEHISELIMKDGGFAPTAQVKHYLDQHKKINKQ